MQFTVPQFIDKEMPMFGPFTVKQFIAIAGSLAVCAIVFFTTGSLGYFFLALIIVGPIGFALGFLKMGNQPMTTFIKNFFLFSIGNKIYLWKRKEVSPKMIRRVREQKPEPAEPMESPLKFAEKSRLKKLSNQMELK